MQAVYKYIDYILHTRHEGGIAPFTLNLGARWRCALKNNQRDASGMLYFRPDQPFVWCGATSAKFGLQVGNVKFNIQNKELQAYIAGPSGRAV